MNYIRKITLKVIGMLFLFSLVSCGEDFLDINTDPNAAVEVSPDVLIPTIQTNLSSTRIVELGPSLEFFTQHWGSTGSAGVFLDPERYTIGTFTPRNTWSTYYGSVMRNAKLMELDARDKNRDNITAQALIIQAHAYFSLTTLFGDIPFSQAVDFETTSPIFDSQEDVLRGVISLIDEANTLINPNAELGGITDADLYFGTFASAYNTSADKAEQMEKWRRYANSVKFKALMFLRSGGASVDSEIAQAINEPMVSELDQDVALPFFDSPNNANNAWKIFLLFSGGDNVWFYAARPTVELMNSLDDPRITTYFAYGENKAGGDTTQIIGVRPGSVSNDLAISTVSSNVVRADAPDRLITASEMHLLKAEAIARGYAGGGSVVAKQELEKGIRLSMDFFDGTEGAISEADKTAYVQRISNSSDLVFTIHQQQYIDLFNRGVEAWAQWRRVKVPTLLLPNQARLGDFIRRLPYSDEETNSNTNFTTQIPLDTPMWFEEN